MVGTILCILFAAVLDSNRLPNPGFESGLTEWSFWIRDSSGARVVPVSPGRSDDSALRVIHDGARDWTVYPKNQKIPVRPGELWEFSAFLSRDSLEGNVSLSFVAYDTSNSVASWGASPSPLQASGSWQKLQARYSVPHGVGWIQPRVVGDGPVRLRLDDVSFQLASMPIRSDTVRIAGDSLSVVFDPLDASLRLDDPVSGKSWRMDGLPWSRVDSLGSGEDSLVAYLHSLQDGWTGRLRMRIEGGALRVRLEADPGAILSAPIVFPGSFATRDGMEIVVPRGTGLLVPVSQEFPANWDLRWVGYWTWQVSQAMTGATDGRTGFVVSLGDGSVARGELRKGPGGWIRPEIVQEPAKGKFGPAREALVAPLRAGGFVEMAARRRQHLFRSGRWRSWEDKIRQNPATERLEGAVDFWVNSGGFGIGFFDSLRRMGMDRALVHWNWASDAVVDSLQARGYLVSKYDNWADAFPGDTTPNGREHPAGAVIGEDGNPMKGWLEIHDDGTQRQALEICAMRHPALARANTPYFGRRLARFVDVELAMTQPECWSSEHPLDRAQDLEYRLRSLGYLHDTLGVVTGSEQARDAALAVVDYGEGPMSIASVADAGYDWSTPEAPEGRMDSMSMTPSLRVPLLPLTAHDGFAPTWYTGDGQSKVPARWDDKDLWNLLYATMPLVMPATRRMWDTLNLRYMRTILAVGSVLRRCQFRSMTGWERLSSDAMVQRSVFDNGWKVVVNFDARARLEGGVDLPPKGYFAGDGAESVERRILAGSVRTLVRLRDRWYLDPEGRAVRLEGVATDRPVLLRRLDDSTLSLALPVAPDSLRLRPDSLPWPASSIRVLKPDGSLHPTSMVDGEVLVRPGGERFLLLRGAFAGWRTSTLPRQIGPAPWLRRSNGGWALRWNQNMRAMARVRLVDVTGRTLLMKAVDAHSGWNEIALPPTASMAWVLLDGRESRRIPVPPR